MNHSKNQPSDSSFDYQISPWQQKKLQEKTKVAAYFHCQLPGLKMPLDEIYTALSLYRLRRYDQCVDLCNKLMLSSVHQKMAYELKMRAVTQRVYVDDIEAEDGVESEFLGTLNSNFGISTSFFNPS